jgi:hypothetical protein
MNNEISISKIIHLLGYITNYTGKSIPEGRWVIEITRPPIHGTTLSNQSPLFKSTGIFDSSAPSCPDGSSISGIG